MRPSLILALPGLLAVLAVGQRAVGQQRDPVYVGARVCASCHAGRGMGHQHSRWLLSKHSLAWAALATSDARKMAELSGLPGEPQETAVCLGCHATASEAEDWEKDPTFFLEDGVQCEKCHGPGSEHVAEEVMKVPEALQTADVWMPTADDCEKCHYVKGSHVAVHRLPKLDLEKAAGRLAHPTPRATASVRCRSPSPGRREAGAAIHGRTNLCRMSPGPGDGIPVQSLAARPARRAYATLATERALEIAHDDGVGGDPQQSPACLRCHTTGHGAGRAFRDTFAVDEGVGCEACHGAGSEYLAEAIMRDGRAALAAGLEPVTRRNVSGLSRGRSWKAVRLRGGAEPGRASHMPPCGRRCPPLQDAREHGAATGWARGLGRLRGRRQRHRRRRAASEEGGRDTGRAHIVGCRKRRNVGGGVLHPLAGVHGPR